MFNPTLRTRLVIDAQEFRFSPHPAVPTLVWGQEGRHAIVYQLKSDGGGAYALKVFRPAFRHPGLIEAADALWTYHELPGMRVCQQRVITRETHPELVAEYEDLDYAMMMPWIEGRTWFDYLQTRERLTLDESRAVAESMAWVLYALEINDVAHCDLSSGNAIVDPRLDQIHLVDVEDLYSPWVEPPPMVPAGSMGYQHPAVSSTGQWGPLGDRFAGAILMAEMLGWAHPDVRRAAWGESYFAPDEIQRESERYEILTDALRVYDGAFTDVFEETWWADSLEACPPLKTWYDLLDALPREPVARWAPVDEALYEEEVPTPPEIAVGAAPAATLPETPPAKPPVPAQKSSAVQRRGCLPFGGAGCRRAIMIFTAVTLVCCVVGILVAQISWMGDSSCVSPVAILGLPLAGIVLASKHYDAFRTF